MKSAYILAALLTLQYVSSAQVDNANKNDSIKILEPNYIYFDLTSNKKEHVNVQLLYDTIEFKDVRYDTTFIMMAFPLIHFFRTYNVKVNLDGGFAKNVTKYFNDYYSPVNNNTHIVLVCYIKKFSITLQYDALEHFNGGDLQDDIANQVNIEIECYYKKGDILFPAVRFDTSYIHHFPNIIVNASNQIKELLQPFMNKIEQVNIQRVEERNMYTEADVLKRYTDRFNVTILKTSIYKKGVYRSFKEFRNNNPSIDSFSISTDKMKVNRGNRTLIDPASLIRKAVQTRNTAIFLYDENNALISPSEIFGYCDGKTIWIQHGAFFYPLEKTGNAFEFMYIYHYTDQNYHTHTAFILSPLNMETGHSN